MKKIGISLLLLVLWPYLGIAFADIQVRYSLFSEAPHVVWQVWLAGAAVLCLVNVIVALRQTEKPVQAGMTAKLLLIAFYAMSFFLGVMLLAAPPAVLMIVLLDGLYMLATSAYTLRGLYLAWRGGKLRSGWAIALAVSQCIFVLDVPGSIAIFAIEKRRSQ